MARLNTLHKSENARYRRGPQLSAAEARPQTGASSRCLLRAQPQTAAPARRHQSSGKDILKPPPWDVAICQPGPGQWRTGHPAKKALGAVNGVQGPVPRGDLLRCRGQSNPGHFCRGGSSQDLPDLAGNGVKLRWPLQRCAVLQHLLHPLPDHWGMPRPEPYK